MDMSKAIVFLGAGGLAQSLLDQFEYELPRRFRGFYVSSEFMDNRNTIDGFIVSDDLRSFDECEFISVVGDPRLTEKLVNAAMQSGLRPAKALVHRLALVSRKAHIGEGSVICAYATVGPDVRIGKHVFVQQFSNVAHGSTIGDCSHVSCHVQVSGDAVVGERCLLGTSTSIRQKIKIGRDVISGMNAAIAKDVPDGVTVVGVPARIVETT
jgi:sugar O-acyltransferase (sialic acid O-acetyltransferase NeuD family)